MGVGNTGQTAEGLQWWWGKISPTPQKRPANNPNGLPAPERRPPQPSNNPTTPTFPLGSVLYENRNRSPTAPRQRLSVFSLVDIPPELCSTETGVPFRNCLVCDRELSGAEYMVEKAVRKYPDFGLQDTVFEYAVCMDCYTTLSANFSEASRERIEAYFRQHVDQDARLERLAEKDADDLHARIGSCMVTGAPMDSLEEYQVVAHCIGNKLVVGPAPFMIGGPAIDEITDLLSNETLDELGGFRDQYFGLPPELQPRVVVL